MLIVNADDFGLAAKINRGIIETIEKGVVGSVSIAANGKAVEEATRYLYGKQNVQTGIHLTLIEEEPVCDPDRIRSLVSDTGKFVPGYSAFMVRYARNAIDLDEVRIELEAQIDKLETLGVRISHCDSHQHIHLLPRIATIVIDLCKKHAIGRVRIVNEAPSPFAPLRVIPLLVMRHYSIKIMKMARKSGIATPDYFFGFNTSMHVTEEIIRRARIYAEKGLVELMCHPGYNHANDDAYSHWNMDWDRERNTLLRAFGKASL